MSLEAIEIILWQSLGTSIVPTAMAVELCNFQLFKLPESSVHPKDQRIGDAHPTLHLRLDEWHYVVFSVCVLYKFHPLKFWRSSLHQDYYKHVVQININFSKITELPSLRLSKAPESPRRPEIPPTWSPQYVADNEHPLPTPTFAQTTRPRLPFALVEFVSRKRCPREFDTIHSFHRRSS